MEVFKTYLRGKKYDQTHIERKTDPTPSDDIYRLGTMWINVDTQRVWVCTDTTTGSAVWVEIDDISAIISSVAANSLNISNIEQALGASDESSIDYTSNNYVNDGEDLVTSVGKLDTEAAAVSGRVSANEGVIASLGTAAFEDVGVASGNVPQLDGSGKLPTSTIPALAISDISVVATIADRDLLTVQEGDIAKVNADPTPANNRSYIYDGASWIDLHPSYIAANEINYDNSTSGLSATQVQDALDELATSISPVSGVTTFFVDLNASGGGSGSITSPFNNIDDVVAARNSITNENVKIYFYSTGATLADTQTVGFSSGAGSDVYTQIIGIGNDTNGKPRMQWDDFTGDGDEYYFNNIDLIGTASFDSTGDTRVIYDKCVVHGQGTNSLGEYIIKQGWIGADTDNGVATEAGLRFGNFIIEGPVQIESGVTGILLSALTVNLHNFYTSIPINIISASGAVNFYNCSLIGKVEIGAGATVGMFNSEASEIELLPASTSTFISRASNIQTLLSSTATGTVNLYNNTVVNTYTNTTGTTITLDETSGILHHTENDDSTVPLNTVTNDIKNLYERGSLWINNNKAYICTDNSSGASRWRHISQDRYQTLEPFIANSPSVAFNYTNRGSGIVFNPADNTATIVVDSAFTPELANGDWVDYLVDAGVTVSSSTAGTASIYGTNPLPHTPSKSCIIRVTLIEAGLNAYMITLLGS